MDHAPDPRFATPTIAARFELGPSLGRGGSGSVRAATDRILRREVALKLIHPPDAAAWARARREVAALLLLDLPGVARLLDSLEVEAGLVLVLERVSGSPFPGHERRDWGSIAAPARALLEILGGVHAAGLVHRDIKPDNVLVDEAGRVTLLDFGLAVGAPTGDRVTRPGGLVGTPRYAAPEQLAGEALDGRADLYALGLVLYERLAGALPHPAERLSELWAARLSRPAPSLRLARPDLPDAVIGLVDRLLARAPEGRPSSAAEALRALGGPAPLTPPWLGSKDDFDQTVEQLIIGNQVNVSGPPGSGRTRLLAELATRLPGAIRLPAADHPFGSLSAWGVPDPTAPGAWAAALLEALRQGGVTPLADTDADPWTVEALMSARVGVVAITGPACPLLAPRTPDDMRAWFADPCRFLHLAEDAAAELHRRSGGHMGRASAELSRWLAEGLAVWEEGRVRLSLDALDRLAARAPLPLPEEGARPLPPNLEALLELASLGWPDVDAEGLARALERPRWQVDLELDRLRLLGALDGDRPRWPCDALSDPDRRAARHRALVRALPPGAPGRARHARAGGMVEEAQAEALRLADAALERGWTRLAARELRATLRLSQAEGHGERPLLEVLAPALLAAQDEVSLRALEYELARATAEVGDLRALTQGWRAARQGQAAAGRALLEGLGPWTGEIERSRLAALAACVQQGPLDAHAAWLEALPEDVPWLPQIRGWQGLLAYRQRRFHDAVALHLEAARGRRDGAGRLASLLNAAGAALEACELDLCLSLAREAGAVAAAQRDGFAEARAAVLERLAEHRLDRRAQPDPSLARETARLGSSWLEGTALAAEAALAWRIGDRVSARSLAREAAACLERANIPPAVLYARAIARAAGDDGDGDGAELVEAARACPLPEVALDVLALAASRGGLPLEAQALARQRAEQIPRETWAVRRGVYSVIEALGRVGGGGGE